MNVVWKPVPGFETRYEVSDTGLVRSLDREIIPKSGPSYFIRGCERKQCKNRRGYFKVSLYKDNRETTFETHRLVALAFMGLPPLGFETRHLDGVRTHNHVSNLVYGTPKQNQQDRFQHGTACVGTKHPLCCLTDKQVNEINKLYSNGLHTMQQLADKYRVVPSTIWRIVNGIRRLTNGKKVRVKDRNFQRSGQRRSA